MIKALVNYIRNQSVSTTLHLYILSLEKYGK